jgi:hypothetical protein
VGVGDAQLVGDDAERLEALANFIRRNPNVLGGGDVLTIVGGKPVARAGMLAAVLAGLSIEGGERAIQKYLIIIPQTADGVADDALAWDHFSRGVERLARRALRPEEANWFRLRFEVRNASDGRSTSLLAVIGDQPERTAVIVVKAATYRDDHVAPLVPAGATTPLMPEDVWVPQLHALARAAVAIAGDKILYVALDADELTPANSELEALLLSVDGCGVRRGLTVHAFELVAAPPTASSLQNLWERRLLDALERCFLDAGPSGEAPVEMSRVLKSMRALLARLAADPLNSVLRARIVDLLRPNIAGTTGQVLIAKLVLDLASEPINISKGFRFGSAGAEWLMDHKPYLGRALAWLQSEQPIVIGKLALPKELLTESTDDAISALASYLEEAPIGDKGDIEALRLYVTLAAALAPHSSDSDIDLRLYRLVAGKLASSGFPQHGRDLVEACMQAGASSSRRRRLAWFAVADVYHRVHDHLTGLVALACTFLADNSADEEQVWQEIYTTARYMRDIGLAEIAFATVAKGREILARMELLDAYGHRLDLLELQLRQAQLQDGDLAGLQALLIDMVRTAEKVLKQHDQTAPSGIALGQLIRQAQHAGLEIPSEANRVFAELNKWAGGNLQSIINATAAARPSVDQLAELVGSLPAARYAEDVGYDTNVIASLARRTLGDDLLLAQVEDVSFVLDVLADWGTALPNWDERASPPPAPGKFDPAAITRAISAEGVAILQLGLDADGRLVRAVSVGSENGSAVREDAELFSRMAFHTWSQEYPRRYGYDETPNIFYTTTEHLRLSASPDAATIVVAATELQTFPPNILFDGNEFLGRKQPVGAVPSLAWFKGARERDWRGDGRMVAWISTAEGEEGRATLSLLAQRLEATFADHGFAVDTGPIIPRNFTGATMAVLTAHGGVHPEGKYFQVVSDEGVLKVSAADLAAAVRNVGVVVLFVCSGGRSDKHPAANTTLGLAKQILDRGCSAVVASPWPLDSQVPAHWLPVFLQHWANGKMLLEATYAANKVVDKWSAFDPARGLAMTVYGNPMLRRP